MAKSIVVADQPTTGIQHIKSQPERFVAYLKDVRSEMRKVITPSRAEVQATTTVVIITVFIFAAYFWLIDTAIGNLIERLLHSLIQH